MTEQELKDNREKTQVQLGKIGLEYSSTLEHLERVATLCESSAKMMGLSWSIVEAIKQAALVHDVGKFEIPPEILDKPRSLNPEEMMIVQQHVKYTSDILEKWGITLFIRLLARQHHERLDGSGYPDHLVGKEIHQVAQILAVADALDAARFRPWGNLPDLIEELRGSVRYHSQIVTVVLKFFTGSLLIGKSG